MTCQINISLFEFNFVKARRPRRLPTFLLIRGST
ncbi:hypothetical protein vseg_001802 [Gypsophila vaccaria]